MKASGYTKLALVLISLLIVAGTYAELLTYYDLNDSSLHQISAGMMADRITRLENPIDFFVPYWACGYPLFGHYQFLPHLSLAVLYLLTFKAVPITFLYHLMIIVLLAAFPWAFFACLRRLGLDKKQALFAAILGLFCHSSIGFGQEFSSYVAYGSGLFTQAFGMIIFPWALANGYELLSAKTRKWFWPVVSLSLLILSQVFLAYLLFFILGFWWLLGLAGPRGRGIGRLAGLVMLVGLTTAFFVLPMVVNSAYHGFSRYEPITKTDSYGLVWVTKNLVNGNLLDAHRYPGMTLLAALGLILALHRKTAALLPAMGFVMAVLFFFGRTTWDGWLQFLPMSKELHFERFILGLHFFGTALAGIAMAWWVDRALAAKLRIGTIAAFAALCLPLIAIGIGSYKYLKDNRAFIRVLSWNYDKDREAVDRLYEEGIGPHSPGRVYSGTRGGWGKNFKLAGVPIYFLTGIKRFAEIGHLPFGWSLAGDFSVLLNERRPDHLDLLNITHIISPRNDSYWNKRLTFLDNQTAVYQTGATGHFDLVSTPYAVRADKYTYWNPVARWFKSSLPGKKAFLRLCFKDGECNPGDYERYLEMKDQNHFDLWDKGGRTGLSVTRAVFEEESPFPETEIVNLGTVLQQSVGRDCYEARISATEQAVALLKITYHPFWRARVNGKKARPFMVSPGFLAVHVPAGDSEVEFYYQTAWWKWLLLVLTAGVLIFLSRRQKRRKEPVTAGEFEPAHNGKTLIKGIFYVSVFLLGFLWLFPKSEMPLERILPMIEKLIAHDLGESKERISIGGIPFDSGIYKKLENQRLWYKVYHLDGSYRRFEVWAGLSDKTLACGGGEAQAVFEAWVDNKLAYRSETLRSGQLPQHVELDLSGKKDLKLVAEWIEGKECAVPTWAGATLFRKSSRQ